MKKFLKGNIAANILISVIMAVMGIVLFVNPMGTMQMISYIIGGIFILLGVVRIIEYIKEKGSTDIFNYNLVYGIVAILIGILAILLMGTIEKIFEIIVGVWIIYCGIIRLTVYLKFRSMNASPNIVSLILSILMILCGLYVLINLGAILSYIGIVILIYAVIDIIENITFAINMKNIID